ncbi:hypothetical protein V6N13_147827 [Hibiscus sabdariffa]
MSMPEGIQKLKQLIERLRNERDGMQRQIEVAKENGDDAADQDFQGWVIRAEEKIKEEEVILENLEARAKKRCFLGLCPNLKSSDLLNDEDEENVKSVGMLIAEASILKFAKKKIDEQPRNVEEPMTMEYLETEPGIIQDFEAFPSREATLEGIMEDLKNPLLKIIGYKCIASEDDAGTLMRNTRENALQKLSAVRFKVLLTSSNEQALSDMKAKSMHKLKVLPDEEGIKWFQKMVGVRPRSSAYQNTVNGVVKNCAGFPVAISAIAVAMKFRRGAFSLLLEALARVTKSIPIEDQNLASVYSTIQLSYRLLEKPELQSLFQLCALLPRGSHIPVSDLLRYNLGLKIERNVSTLEEARKSVNGLKDAGLLLRTDSDKLVRMHDIVRDVSIWIASEEQRIFVIEDEVRMKKLLRQRKLNNCSAISLPYSDINELPDKLECPRLKLLLKNLHVQNGSEIQFIINSMEAASLKAFPILESLFLQNLINLEKICQGKLEDECFKRLKIVSVECCDRLKNLFPFSVTKMLVQLREIKVSRCKSIGQIIAEESEQSAGITTNKTNFGQLQSLTLQLLPELSSFCSKEKSRSIYQLEPVNTRSWILFNEKVINNMEELSLSSKHISIICNRQLIFSQTKVLQVLGNDDETVVFPFVIYSGLDGNFSGEGNASEKKLERELVSLPNPTLLGEENSQIHQVSPNLETLEARRCEGLISLGPFSTSFQNLITLDLWHCHAIALMTSSAARNLLQLIKMRIRDCVKVREIVAKGKDDAKDMISFSKLKCLVLHYLPNLTSFCSEEYKFHFPSLEQVIVRQCPKLKIFCHGVLNTPKLHRVQLSEEDYKGFWAGDLSTTINQLHENTVRYYEPEHLKLHEFPELEEIWNTVPQGIVDFKRLKFLEVYNCNTLRYLLTASMAEDLVQLQQIKVKNCRRIEEIIRDDKSTTKKIIIPQLKTINIKSCLGLACFCSGTFALECPNLKEVTLVSCAKMIAFASTVSNEPQVENIGGGYSKILAKSAPDVSAKPFFSDKGTFPCLEELRLESNATMKEIWHGQLPEGYFKLKVLELLNFPALTVLPPYFFHSLSNLENFVVSDASFNEIFLCEELGGDEKLEGPLAQLSVLRLSKLHELTHRWKESFNPGEIFFNMRVLQVQDCGKLDILVPPSVSFKNLTTLEVSRCQGLKHLFAHSTAKSLVQLTRMSITDCNMIEEIVGCSGGEVKEGIEFSQLKCLGLSCLPNLSSFSSGNCTFEFPSLETVILRHCPKMRTFPQKRFIAPKLQPVYSTEAGDAGPWEGDQNTTIQLLFMETVQYREIEYVVLSDSSMLMEIRNWNPQGILDFKNLRFLKVYNCRNLRYLFNPSMAMDLVHLEKFEIHDCEMLEEVINTKGLSKKERMSKKMFPKLVTLLLIALSNLTRFCSGNYHEFPFLKELWIQSCPMLQTFISSSATRNNLRQNPNTGLTVLFDEKVEFPSLEKLGIIDMGNLRKLCNDQIPMGLFSKLKVLKLMGFPKQSDVIPSAFFLSLSKLERLVVDDATFSEVFLCEGIEEKMQAWELASFSDLWLSRLPELMHLWKEDFQSQPPILFQNLKTLKVLECPKLKYLVPSTVSFQNLTTLEISRCHGLRTLITPSTAKSMVQLKSMRITDCKKLEGIVEDAGDSTNVIIIFKHLEYFRLQSLPALTSFCSGYYHFKFPSLVELVAIECPEFSYFCKGEVSTPSLKRVCPTEEVDRSFTDEDLNATIKGLYSEKARNDVKELEFLQWTLSDLWRPSG